MHFLIIKTSALGDIVHALPVAAFLKKHFPDSRIDWVVEKRCAELLHRFPCVDRVIEIDTKKRQFKGLRETRYDVAFDLQGNCKSGLLLLLAKAKVKAGFGRKSVTEWPNLLVSNWKYNPPPGQNIRLDYLSLVAAYFKLDPTLEPVELQVTDQEKARVDQLLEGIKHPVVVAPGSRWPNKCLTSDALAYLLKRRHEAFYFFSYDTDPLLYELFQERGLLLPKGPLIELYYLMSRVELVISMDSLPLHLAGLTKTPTLSFFGPSSKAKYAPLGSEAQQGACPYGEQFEKRCPKLRSCPTGACLKP